MPLFRKDRTSRPTGGLPIPAFWRWWTTTGAAQVAAALERRDPGSVVEAISNRVDTINPALQWELARGQRSQHALVLSGGGDPTLRRTTERWVRGAPAGDSIWEYWPARQPDVNLSGMKLGLGGHTVTFDDVTVGISAEPDSTRIDGVVHHPTFAAMAEDTRGQAMYLILDATLGEDDVERWIGAATRSTTAVGAGTLADLRTAVADPPTPARVRGGAGVRGRPWRLRLPARRRAAQPRGP